MPERVVDVSIALQTTSVSQVGFGIPLFIGAHRWFNERVKTYSSIKEVEADCPAGSDERIAATGAFSQTPSISQFKLGRRETDIILTPDVPAEGDVYSFTIVDTDLDSYTISFTALASPDAEDIVDGLIGVMAGETELAAHILTSKNGATTAATLQIAPKLSSDAFSISDIVKQTDTYPATEAAGTVLTAIEAVDEDFYFATAHDHTETFVLALAAAIEARNKQYFVSVAEDDALSALPTPAVDIAGKLKEFNYLNTNAFYHDDADTAFPECAFAGKGAPFTPGTITWAHQQLAGVATPISTVTGLALSSTEQDALIERNCNYLRNLGGVNVIWPATVASGNFIDETRIVHFLVARITEAYQIKLINSLKVSYTDIGIGEMQNVLTSLLSRYVETPAQPNILQENNPFTTNFPRARDVSAADKTNRKLVASFEAFLAGAIHTVAITGSLSLDV